MRGILHALSRREWARLGLIALVVLAINGFGWGIYNSTSEKPKNRNR